MHAHRTIAAVFALAATGLVAGTPATAQPDAAADAAAEALVDDLRPLSLVAATAALYQERTGAYPATPFELLGSPEAERTGLRDVQFAELTIHGELAYRLANPTLGARAERSARISFEYEPDSAQHVATFEIVAHRDRDFGGRRIPLAVSDPLEVRVARGRLCLASSRLAELADADAFARQAPYFGDRRALSVSFDGPGG